jgi:orotate phosphoribosyltransferase
MSAAEPNILKMDFSTLRVLMLHDVRRILTPEEITHIFQACQAHWQHSGDPKRPHAELTSGKCSNGFVDTLRVLRYANLCLILADQIVRMIRAHHDHTLPDIRNPASTDWVIGSDHAGATLSFSVAFHLNALHDFTEKGSDGSQLWKRFAIDPGQRVLQVEELITTTKTLNLVRQGIRAGNQEEVEFMPYTATLVHRSPTPAFEGGPILSLVHYDIETWEPDQCPLCQAGSKRIKPKANWKELTETG